MTKRCKFHDLDEGDLFLLSADPHLGIFMKLDVAQARAGRMVQGLTPTDEVTPLDEERILSWLNGTLQPEEKSCLALAQEWADLAACVDQDAVADTIAVARIYLDLAKANGEVEA